MEHKHRGVGEGEAKPPLSREPHMQIKRVGTTHLSEWPRPKTPTTLNTGDVVELQEFLFFTGAGVGGDAKTVWPLQKTVSYKTK